jgi:RNA ligase (TIGR02306 family)
MKLASIEVIKKIKKHPNADSLEIVEILGWQTIVKKGLHKDGDKVVFITIDTIVPRCHWSEFLVDQKNPDKPIRIKNIKLRGEYSSGLVISLDEFPDQFTETTVVGEDLTTLLGIQKYIKEIPANLSGETEGDFPTEIISKTDEDNGLSDPELVKQVLSHDFVTVTQKMDGSSITIIVEDGKINKVCTRNLAKKDTGKSPFWEAAKKLNIPQGWTGAIQGELCGNGIQSNPIGLEGIEMFVYQIKQNHEYLNYDEMKNICENQFKCKVVPHIIKLEKKASIDIWDDPLSKLQQLADNQFYPNKKPAEGIVVRPSHYPRSFSSRRPLGFKLINRNYKD